MPATFDEEPVGYGRTGRPPETVREYFANELRRHRRVAGLTQEQLALAIHYSAAMVGMVEKCQRGPTHEFTMRCDKALECHGALLRVWPLLSQDSHPTWFKSFVALESDAVAIHEFEVLAVPGLLQTEAYARANLLAAWPPKPSDEFEMSLTARLERQQILEREQPPMLWFILDESVLLRPYGSASVMADQLRHLLKLAGRPTIRLSILPMARSPQASVDGAFVVLELKRGEWVAYVEGPGVGRIIADVDGIERCRLGFDALRSQTLSAEDSAELIFRTIGERYEHS